MRGNRKRDTNPELLLRRALWRAGYRYRLHVSNIPGRPDLVFPRARVVVFCDGDFWHGRDWPELREKLERRANSGYWIPKIEGNIRRDRQQEAALAKAGWAIVRIWEGEIREDVAAAADLVISLIKERSAPKYKS